MKALFIVCAGLVVSGCQWVIDVDAAQCKDDAECVGLLGRGFTCGAAGVCKQEEQGMAGNGGGGDAGPRLPARWACAEDPYEVPSGEPDEQVRVAFDIIDHTTLSVPEDLTAKACAPTDVACSEPLQAGVEPDEDGLLEFDLPFGFNGYFEMQAPDYVPSLQYSNLPRVTEEPFAGPNLVTEQALRDISDFGGETWDPELGTVILETTDCEGEAGDGLRFVLKENSDNQPFYFEGALPDRGLDQTVVTTALGRDRLPRAVGGFSNVDPGFVTFEAWLVETETRIMTYTAQVRAGYATYVRMHAGY